MIFGAKVSQCISAGVRQWQNRVNNFSNFSFRLGWREPHRIMSAVEETAKNTASSGTTPSTSGATTGIPSPAPTLEAVWLVVQEELQAALARTGGLVSSADGAPGSLPGEGPLLLCTCGCGCEVVSARGLKSLALTAPARHHRVCGRPRAAEVKTPGWQAVHPYLGHTVVSLLVLSLPAAPLGALPPASAIAGLLTVSVWPSHKH